MDLLNKIFSIKNISYAHKQICFLGLKLKLKRKHDDINALDIPIKNNKIIFRTFNSAYNCNPKYIAQEILRQNLDYELVWVVNNNILNFIYDFPRNIKLVMVDSPEEIKETYSAKIIIDNERRTSYIKRGINKRDKQVYIQTFHGSFGIKKTGIDRKDISKKALKLCEKDSMQIDYLISNGKWTTDFFKRMFFGYGKILEYGHPRNDIFFQNDNSIKEKVHSYFNIPQDTKIILYAPTLRETRFMDSYNLDIDKIKKAVEEKFGGNWVVITRLHPLLLPRRDEFIPKGSEYIEGTQYSDMQELLASTDLLITDYSSCIYDYMLSYKPAFIYATDIENYDTSRGLYYPLTSTPFPVAKNNDEMVGNILSFDYEGYKAKVSEFLKGKGSLEDGNASKRVVELIKSIIKEGE